MSDVLKIVAVSLFSCYMIGCGASEQNKPIWEQVKIRDIAPAHNGEKAGTQEPEMIGFDVCFFEVPAENISNLDNVWRLLHIQPLRFSSYKAFVANLFAVRFGQIQSLNAVESALINIGSQKVLTISLLLPDGQLNDVTIKGLITKQEVHYTAADGSTEEVTIGPGICSFRIKAEKIPGSRGICKLFIYPVFTIPMAIEPPQITARTRTHEFLFTSVAFGLKVGAGDFVLLGPQKYVADQSTLCGLFLGKPEGNMFFDQAKRKPPKHKPAFRVLLIICTRIGD